MLDELASNPARNTNIPRPSLGIRIPLLAQPMSILCFKIEATHRKTQHVISFFCRNDDYLLKLVGPFLEAVVVGVQKGTVCGLSTCRWFSVGGGEWVVGGVEVFDV